MVAYFENLFPTPVGMNRWLTARRLKAASVPHARGDEPFATYGRRCLMLLFPTPVGMNRLMRNFASAARSVPHARGDEPCGSSQRRREISLFPTPVGMNRPQS